MDKKKEKTESVVLLHYKYSKMVYTMSWYNFINEFRKYLSINDLELLKNINKVEILQGDLIVYLL